MTNTNDNKNNRCNCNESNNKKNKNINIEVILTQACNFRCTYCYERDTRSIKSITNRVISALPDFVQKTQQTYNSDEIFFQFFGGEPTLQSNAIIDITNSLAHLPYIKFGIITNGYNIDKIKPLLLEIKNTYGPNKFYVQISYDYYLQEQNRLHLNGRKTKEKVLSSILWLASNSINFSVKPTITVPTLPYIDKVYFEFIELRDKIKQLGYTREFSIKPTIDTCHNSIIYSSQNLQDILPKFRQAMTNILEHQIQNKDENYKFAWLLPSKAQCSTGYKMICIDYDGSLYPCHGAVFSDNKELHKYKFDMFDPNCFSKLFRKIRYIAPKNSKCNTTCKALYCDRCPIHTFDKNINRYKTYYNRMIGYSEVTSCNINEEITKFIYAKSKILSNLEKE